MKVGVVYPQYELGSDPEILARFARAAEAMGFDHLVLYDHVAGAARVRRDPPLWDGPHSDTHAYHEPLTAFAYLAGITRTIEFVTGILILPQRQTVLVAKQAAEVDLLSHGRLHLGVGSGSNYVEYDAMGQNFADRGARLSEQIPFLRRLWDEPLVSFEGRFDRIDRGNICPRPRRRIPIHCGGYADPAYRRAAKLADGFIFAGDVDEAALPGWQRVRALLAQEGRVADDFRSQYLVQRSRGDGAPVAEALAALRKWQEAGGTHATIVTLGLGFGCLDDHLEHLEAVRAKADCFGRS